MHGAKINNNLETSKENAKKVKSEECARPKDACYRRDARRVKNRLMPVGYEERKNFEAG